MEQVEVLQKEVASIRSALVERDRKIARLERMIKDAISNDDISKQIVDINSVLQGRDGKNGLKGSVNRLLMLVDGNEQYCIVGIMDQIISLREEVSKLVTQRDQLKWALFGIGAITGLGSYSDIALLIKTILGY